MSEDTADMQLLTATSGATGATQEMTVLDG